MSLRARFSLGRGRFALAAELEVPAAGITGLYGPSGSGKTTLLRCLAGLESQAQGVVEVDGETWQDSQRRRFVPPHRRGVGYVFQEAALFPHLTVRGNLEYARRRAPQGRLAWDEVVALTGVAGLLERGVSGLSGGERQRVAIARALLGGPRLLLMDEPMASLDRRSRHELLPYLERLHAELAVPVVYVSHAVRELARLADHLLLMEQGRIVASGPLRELVTRIEEPHSRLGGAVAVLDATVREHDARHHLTRLSLPGGDLYLPREDLEPGASVRVLVHPRDVILSLDRPEGTSLINVLPAEVVEVAPLGPAETMVRLQVEGAPLLAHVTRRAEEELGVRPGLRLYALVEAVSLQP